MVFQARKTWKYWARQTGKGRVAFAPLQADSIPKTELAFMEQKILTGI